MDLELAVRGNKAFPHVASAHGVWYSTRTLRQKYILFKMASLTGVSNCEVFSGSIFQNKIVI